MKTIKTLALFVIGLITLSCNSNVEPKTTDLTKTDELIKDNYVAIYDFHNEHRCVTCIKIENAVRNILDESFKPELEKGQLTFELFNCEADENQELAEEYGAFGTTLAITVIKDGNKEILDLTNWAFEMVDSDEFNTEFSKDVKTALAKLN